MTLIKISKATWDDVIAEYKANRVQLGLACLDDQERLSLSLRAIAVKRNIGSYETVRNLIAEARCYQDANKPAKVSRTNVTVSA
jgi:hypothetical protein